MPSRPILLALAAGLLALLSSSCARKGEAEAPSPAAASEAPTVAVAKVAAQNLSNDLVLTAEFKPFQEVDVMAKVAGYVKEIRVDVGDRVKAGELLATLEVPEMADDLRRDQAAVDRSQADVARAQDELQRAESAHEMAHLAYHRLAAVAQISAARSAISAAQQQVDVNKAELQKVRTLIDYTRVTAPFTGVVTKRYADTGSMIQAGTANARQVMPVVTISENSLLRLILPVPESAVPTVHIGQAVEVNVPTLHRTFPGRVARFADKLSLATRTMDTEVDVPNPDLVLIPGMYAEVDLTLNRHNGVLTVPVTAVDIDPADTARGEVMLVAPNNRVEQRRIELGMQTANRVEVRAGLNEGDLVVVTGRAALQSGQEVKPKLTNLTADSGQRGER